MRASQSCSHNQVSFQEREEGTKVVRNEGANIWKCALNFNEAWLVQHVIKFVIMDNELVVR